METKALMQPKKETACLPSVYPLKLLVNKKCSRYSPGILARLLPPLGAMASLSVYKHWLAWLLSVFTGGTVNCPNVTT